MVNINQDASHAPNKAHGLRLFLVQISDRVQKSSYYLQT